MCAVEWKKLGDVCEILDSQRKPISKSKRVFGCYPYYGANGIQDYVDGYIFDGTYLLVGEDGSVINKDNSPVLHWVSGQFWVNNHAHILSDIKDTAILKYLYYVLHTIDVSDIVRGVPPKLNQENLKNIILPIPSLAKQQEIVSQLDTFTTLISNLESELYMRRKQYEHYRNQLFGDTLELLLDKVDKGEMEVSTLSEVGTFTRGRRFVRTDIMTEGTPCIHYGDMYTYYGVSAKTTPTFLLPEVAAKLRFAQENDVVIVGAGENNEDIGIGVAWLGNEDVAVHDACYIFKHKMNPLYISYYLRTDIYHKQIKKYVSSGKICSISSDGIGKSIIPIPSSKTQQQIVEKLDAFEQLIQSLETEIKLRKQQYEYYREKLLTFE